MKPTRTLALLSWIALASAGCPRPDHDAVPACVPGFQQGELLQVRLGPVYDAASDYWYDDALLTADLTTGSLTPSCAGVDGLATGSVVSFRPVELSYRFSNCSPWLAEFDPNLGLAEEDGLLYPDHEGVTIAVAGSHGPLDGQETSAAWALLTPSKDPQGTATPRKLPPLVVARRLGASSGFVRCADAWVATWEPAP